MNFIVRALKKAKEKRLAAKAERQRLNNLFDKFARETRPLVPKAPRNPEAALYRMCWKRAIVLEDIYTENGDDRAKVFLYKEFQQIAADRYSPIAPENAYGKIYLKITGEARYKMRIQEIKRIQPYAQNKLKQNLDLACIYMGIDNAQNKPYIGQTTGNPETRWKEHRNNVSGPFKNGAKYATWKVLEESVPQSKLNKLEAYYIGLFDAYENGHNDTSGNDWEGYERGKKNYFNK